MNLKLGGTKFPWETKDRLGEYNFIPLLIFIEIRFKSKIIN